MSNSHELSSHSPSPESIDYNSDTVETALRAINNTEHFVADNIGLKEPELTIATNEALVYVAGRTIEEVNRSGTRTAVETLGIENAIEAVIVQGVSKETSSTNPIIEMKRAGMGQELDSVIGKLSEQGVKLPNGEDVAEKAGEILAIPSVLYRGERVYLNSLEGKKSIDDISRESLSTKGHERTSNQDGRVYSARDIEYARAYSVGTDGVTFYDRPLTKEEIPIGVIYEINNKNNVINAVADGEPVPDIPELGEIAGKHREFTSGDIPPELCRVAEIQIMDDYSQPNGHTRSDFRQVLETFIVESPDQMPEVIEKVKARIDKLDALRQAKRG